SVKPASLFGGDYNTYVLWAVPPEGEPENLGEMILNDDRSRLVASTPTCGFALIITAEPPYLVRPPSALFVLQNNPWEWESSVRYRVLEGVYNFARSSLENAKPAKGTVHTEIRQAFTAVRLAQRAGAGRWASDEYLKARRALDQLMARRSQGVDRTQIA